MKNKSKLGRLLFVLIIILNVVNIGFWGILIYPFKVIEVKSVTILTPVVERGGFVRWESEFCKYHDAAGLVQRKLVNHFEYTLATEVTNRRNVGCYKITGSAPIPDFVEEGQYRVSNDIKHTLFGIRDVYTHWETPEFTVVSSGGIKSKP